MDNDTNLSATLPLFSDILLIGKTYREHRACEGIAFEERVQLSTTGNKTKKGYKEPSILLFTIYDVV